MRLIPRDREEGYYAEGEDEALAEKRRRIKALALEKREMELTKEVEETRKAVAALRRETEALSSSGTQAGLERALTGIGQAIAALTAAGVPPEKVDEFLKKLSPEALMAVSLLSSNNPNLALLAYANVFARRGEGHVSAADLLTSMAEARKADAEMLRAFSEAFGKKPSEGALVQEWLKDTLAQNRELMAELMKARESAVMKEIMELKNRPGPLQELISRRDEILALRDIFFGGAIQPSVEIEKIRMERDAKMREHDLAIEKMRLDMERWKAEQQWNMEKWRMERQMEAENRQALIKTLYEPIAPSVGRLVGALAERMSARMGTAAAAPQVVAQQAARPQPAQAQEAYTFPCQFCGETIAIPIQELARIERVSCPRCGREYVKQAQQAAQPQAGQGGGA